MLYSHDFYVSLKSSLLVSIRLGRVSLLFFCQASYQQQQQKRRHDCGGRSAMSVWWTVRVADIPGRRSLRSHASVICKSVGLHAYRRWPGFLSLWTNRLEYSSRQRDFSSVSADLSSESENLLIPNLLPWYYSEQFVVTNYVSGSWSDFYYLTH